MHEQLKKKIEGVATDDELSSGGDDDSLQVGQSSLDLVSNDISRISSLGPQKGVYGMKFMQRAAGNELKETLAAVNIARAEIEAYGKGVALESDEDSSPLETVGRRIYDGSEVNVQDDLTAEYSAHQHTEIKSAKSIIILSKPLKSLFPVAVFDDDVLEVPETYFPADANQHIDVDPAQVSFERQNVQIAINTSNEAPAIMELQGTDHDRMIHVKSNDCTSNPWLNAQDRGQIFKAAVANHKHHRSNKQEQGLARLQSAKDQILADPQIDSYNLQSISEISKPKSNQRASANLPIVPVESESDQDSDYGQAEHDMIHKSHIDSIAATDVMKMAFANDDVIGVTKKII